MAKFVAKRQRKKDYDYSTPGSYFVTVCTVDRLNLLCELLPQDTDMILYNYTEDGPKTTVIDAGAVISILTPYGKVTIDGINGIHEHYPTVSVERFVLMPNHIHMILHLKSVSETASEKGPSVSEIIRQFKRFTTIETGRKFWQDTFHDRIIRSEDEYNNICKYIDYNPINWTVDEDYMQ